MPSSSFLLRSSTTFLSAVSLLSTSTLAAPQLLAARQATTPAYSYTLDQQYSGSTFFDDFTFFSTSDPTHGFVTYGDRSYAQTNGLIGFDGDYAVMQVDSSTNLGKGLTYYHDHGNGAYANTNGVGRKSVRIEGTYQFTHGLVIADFGQIPGGICGTWPAFWTLGAGQWPLNGEIDIVEGANLQGGNWMSLHTGSASNINGDTDSFSANIVATDCNDNTGGSGTNPVGCKFADPDPSTYDNYGGGVWAMQWTSDRIKVWYWPYASVPQDVTNGAPQPGSSAWGTPRASFAPPQNLKVDQNFNNHHIVFDTTFCGDLGDPTWASTGCAAKTGFASCADFVANTPSAFANAKWKVKYVKIYKEGPVVTSSSPTTTASKTTTSSSQAQTSSSITTSSSSKTSTTSSSTTTPSLLAFTTTSSATAKATSSPTSSNTKPSSSLTTSSSIASSATKVSSSSLTTPATISSSTTASVGSASTSVSTTKSVTSSSMSTSSSVQTTSSSSTFPIGSSTTSAPATSSGSAQATSNSSTSQVSSSTSSAQATTSSSSIASSSPTSSMMSTSETSSSSSSSTMIPTTRSQSSSSSYTTSETGSSTTVSVSVSVSAILASTSSHSLPSTTSSEYHHGTPSSNLGSGTFTSSTTSPRPWEVLPGTTSTTKAKPADPTSKSLKSSTTNTIKSSSPAPWETFSVSSKPKTTAQEGGGFYTKQASTEDGSDVWITTTVTDTITVPCTTVPAGYETKTTVYVTVVPSQPDQSHTVASGFAIPSSGSDTTSNGNINSYPSSIVAPSTWVTFDPSAPIATASYPSAFATLTPHPAATSPWSTWAVASVPTVSSSSASGLATTTTTGFNQWKNLNATATGVQIYHGAASSLGGSFRNVAAVAMAVLATILML